MTKENNQGMRDLDSAIMDFQIHVREVTGGNHRACVDSTELKAAIIKYSQSEISLLKKGIEESRRNTPNEFDIGSEFSTPRIIRDNGFNQGLEASLEVFRKAGE